MPNAIKIGSDHAPVMRQPVTPGSLPCPERVRRARYGNIASRLEIRRSATFRADHDAPRASADSEGGACYRNVL